MVPLSFTSIVSLKENIWSYVKRSPPMAAILNDGSVSKKLQMYTGSAHHKEHYSLK